MTHRRLGVGTNVFWIGLDSEAWAVDGGQSRHSGEGIHQIQVLGDIQRSRDICYKASLNYVYRLRVPEITCAIILYSTILQSFICR